ncbi:MAG: hypothetical protein ACLQDQ_05595 [Myxococcaceae bacterium]
MRTLGIAALVTTVVAAGCGSSSNSYLCCYDYNGNMGAWSCPTSAAYTACCGAEPTTEPGCITNPGTCTMVAESECN